MADKQCTPPAPCLLAALLCDQVIREMVTGKPTLVGVFEHVAAVDFPAVHPRITFFSQLTNGHGKTPILIKLVDVENDDTVVIEHTMDVEFRDVRDTVSAEFTISPLIIPHEGEYRFQLYARTEFLGERRFICRKIQMLPGGTRHE